MVTPEVSGVMVSMSYLYHGSWMSVVMVSSEAPATSLMFFDVILISDLCVKLWLGEERDI